MYAGNGAHDLPLVGAWFAANRPGFAQSMGAFDNPIQTRPLFPYPAVAIDAGHGSSDDAANFFAK